MLRFGTDILENALNRWSAGVLSHARSIVLAAIVLTLALGYYTATHIAINTDTDRMIDPDLPFRQAYDDFNAAFPQLADSFIIVIDAGTTEQADLAAKRLVEALQGRDELFLNVLAPGIGPFFETNGLLFEDVEELQTLTDRLADAAPILSALNEDPSLRGLADVMILALDDAMAKRDAPERLPEVLRELTPIAEAAARGEKQLLSWSEMMAEEDADLGEMRRRIIMAQPVLDYSTLPPAKASLEAARALGAEIERTIPGVNVRFTGKMALGAEELKSVADGAELSALVSLILVTLVLGFGIRSLRLVIAALATLVMGLVWTAAFALAAVGYLNIISVAFAVLFIGLGIDFAIHFALRYREEVQAGADIDGALRKAALGVGGPLAICAPTTALAFYAFVPTAYAGLAQLGIISGTGMFISLFSSLTVLPALLKLMPIDRAPINRRAKPSPLVLLGQYVDRHERPLTTGGLALGALALAAIPFVQFQYDPIRLKDPDTESVTTYLDLTGTGKNSPYAVQIVAAGVEEANRIAEDIKALPDVSRVVTLSSFVPKNQDEKLALLFDASIFLTPIVMSVEPLPTPTIEERWTAASALEAKLAEVANSDVSDEMKDAAGGLQEALQAASADKIVNDALLLFEQGALELFPATIERLRSGLRAAPVMLDDVPQDLRTRYRTADGRVRVEIFPEANVADQAELSRFVSTIRDAHGAITGNAVQVIGAGEVVVGAMQQATITAGLLIILFLGLILHSRRDVALIAAPVALAAILTAAATVVLSQPFNFANVIVLPLLIGLGVDSGIHLVMRAREARQSDSEASVRQTSTPRAVVLSALTTIGSFGSLALSAHRGTASMGILLTVSVLLTLAATLVVLPGLISWAYRHDAKSGDSASK